MLTQDRSVAQTPHRGVCCLCKREVVGAQPLHLAIARPFCRLKAPLGLSLLHFVSQTRTCRSETPPSCAVRKPVLSLESPPLGLSLLHFVSQARTCRGAAPPSCYRKTVPSLESPTGAFIASLRFASANLLIFISRSVYSVRFFFQSSDFRRCECRRFPAALAQANPLSPFLPRKD